MVFGFELPSTELFGLGERFTDFVLREGTYMIYSADNALQVDTGESDAGREQGGQHPFVMAKLAGNQYIGVYLNNANA